MGGDIVYVSRCDVVNSTYIGQICLQYHRHILVLWVLIPALYKDLHSNRSDLYLQCHYFKYVSTYTTGVSVGGNCGNVMGMKGVLWSVGHQLC